MILYTESAALNSLLKEVRRFTIAGVTNIVTNNSNDNSNGYSNGSNENSSQSFGESCTLTMVAEEEIDASIWGWNVIKLKDLSKKAEQALTSL